MAFIEIGFNTKRPLILGRGGFGTQLNDWLMDEGWGSADFLDDNAPDAVGGLRDYVDPAILKRGRPAFVALGDRVGPISLLDTPGIRKADRHAETAPATALPPRSPARTRWPHSMRTPSCAASSAATPLKHWNSTRTAPPATCCGTIPSGWSVCAPRSAISAWKPAAPAPGHWQGR